MSPDLAGCQSPGRIAFMAVCLLVALPAMGADGPAMTPSVSQGLAAPAWELAPVWLGSEIPGRAIDIRWLGRERGSIEGYRITLRIADGPLAGVEARWLVPAETRLGADKAIPHSYHLRLPIRVPGEVALHATIDAVSAGGAIELASRRVVSHAPRATGSDGSGMGHSTGPHRAGSPALTGGSRSPVQPPTAVWSVSLVESALRAPRQAIAAFTGIGTSQGRAPPPSRA